MEHIYDMESNKIWNKIGSNDKYMKTKIKTYNDKVVKNFEISKMQRDNEYFTCLSVVLLYSIFVNSDKKYYPQIFSK